MQTNHTAVENKGTNGSSDIILKKLVPMIAERARQGFHFSPSEVAHHAGVPENEARNYIRREERAGRIESVRRRGYRLRRDPQGFLSPIQQETAWRFGAGLRELEAEGSEYTRNGLTCRCAGQTLAIEATADGYTVEVAGRSYEISTAADLVTTVRRLTGPDPW